MKKERNLNVDRIRGLAMLLVVLGHTLTGSSVNSENTFLFQVIWSLQMPLFILISGFVTRYSKKLNNGKDLFSYVKKRTISYLLPWAVWTFLIRGLVFGYSDFLNPKFIFWHMDSGYWFLFTIWTICMIFGVSSFLSNKIANGKNQILKIFICGIFYVIGMIALAALGYVFGLSFLCIKLTLYYMPFYFLGHIYGKFYDELKSKPYFKTLTEIVICACFVIWIVLIKRFNLYAIEDSVPGILLRAIASLTGCIAICGLLPKLFDSLKSNNKIASVLHWCGVYSLDVYLIHGLVLNMVTLADKPRLTTVNGFILVLVNFILTVVITSVVSMLLNKNKYLKLFILGKTK